MCGRHALYRSLMDYENALVNAGGLTIDRGRGTFDELPPNYNVTPSRAVWIARQDSKNVWLEPVVWGLLPRWDKATNAGPRLCLRSRTRHKWQRNPSKGSFATLVTSRAAASTRDSGK